MLELMLLAKGQPATKFHLDLTQCICSVRTMQLGRTTHMPVPNSRRVMRTRSTAIHRCGQKAVVVTVRSCGGCSGSFCHSERVWKCGADILSAGSGSLLLPVPSPRHWQHGAGMPREPSGWKPDPHFTDTLSEWIGGRFVTAAEDAGANNSKV